MFEEYMKVCATHGYVYSYNDCMTFPIGWHDKQHNTNILDDLRGYYYDKRTSIVFYNRYFKVEEWLDNYGYSKVDKPEYGDFVLFYEDKWPFVHIYYNRFLYFLHEERMLKQPYEAFQEPHTIWRKDTCHS